MLGMKQANRVRNPTLDLTVPLQGSEYLNAIKAIGLGVDLEGLKFATEEESKIYWDGSAKLDPTGLYSFQSSKVVGGAAEKEMNHSKVPKDNSLSLMDYVSGYNTRVQRSKGPKKIKPTGDVQMLAPPSVSSGK